MNEQYADYLRGKRVVLVVPAGNMTGRGLGELIDGYDVVVRLNGAAPIRPDLHERVYPGAIHPDPADHGSRTDVLYHTLMDGGPLSAALGHDHTTDEVDAWIEDGVRFLVSRQVARAARVQRLEPLLREPLQLVTMDRDFYRVLKNATQTPPSMGILAIADLLRYQLAELHVLGMDFYRSRYPVGYNGFTPEQAARGTGAAHWGQVDRTSGSFPHDQDSQKRYLRRAYDSDRRLTLDDVTRSELGLPFDGPKVTALVPMKGQSERVPGKNTRLVAGKPLLAWLLTALVSARRVSRVVVDTDDEQIAALVREHAPSVEILTRPDHLRDGDAVTGNDLIAWELTQVDGEHFGQFHVTSPLLEAATIDRAVDEYFRGLDQHDSLFAVSEHHIWLFRADGSPVNSDTRRLVRSQDLEPLYEDNNAIHLFSRASFARTGSRMGERPRMFPISKVEATDIDYEDDFRIAEALLQLREAESRERGTRKAKSPMGAVVYSTQKQPDGSYAVRGAVNGDKRTVYAQFEGDPTIAMCKQALLDGGTSAAGAVEPGSESPPGESDSTAGQPDGAEDAQQPEGNAEQDAEHVVLVAALLDLSVEALEEQLPTVEDAALLEAALAVEQSEDGKGRKGAVAALEARIAALAEGIKV
ncbi:MAG: acylneuraminate cytidylyltransferase family protein [Dehalococcoidia bacterium]|nr:acylneuraminate cytidylyltransferase family protein [Dehalococcoidia bacterium]